MAFSPPPQFSTIEKTNKQKPNQTDLRKKFFDETVYYQIKLIFYWTTFSAKTFRYKPEVIYKDQKIAFSEEHIVKRHRDQAHEKCYSTLFHYLILLWGNPHTFPNL